MFWWLLYFLVVLLASLAVGRHLGRFRESCTEMTGMMAGMTIGMLGGFALGYGMTAAAGRNLFIGNLIGVLLGAALGGWFGRTGGLMGIMDGSMGGVMGGSMGAMIAAMVFPDWALNWTGVLFGGVYVAGSAALVALIESRAPEHEHMHWLLPKLALVRREPRYVSHAGGKSRGKGKGRAATHTAAKERTVNLGGTSRQPVQASTRAAARATASAAVSVAVAPPMQDYYALLGVETDAGLDRIEEGYLDLLASADAETTRRADRALTTLSDPDRRAMYNAALAESRKRQPAATAADGRGDCCPPPKNKAAASQPVQPVAVQPVASTQRTKPVSSAAAPVHQAYIKANVQGPSRRAHGRVRRVTWQEYIARTSQRAQGGQTQAHTVNANGRASTAAAPAPQSAPTKQSTLAPSTVARTTAVIAATATATTAPARATTATSASPRSAPAPQPAQASAATKATQSTHGRKHGKKGKRGKQSNYNTTGDTGQRPPAAQSTLPIPQGGLARRQVPQPYGGTHRGSGSSERGYGSTYGNGRRGSRRPAYAEAGWSFGRRFAIGMTGTMAAGVMLMIFWLLSQNSSSGTQVQGTGYLNQSPPGAVYHVPGAVPSEAQLEGQAVAATVGPDGIQTADLLLDQSTSSYKPGAIKVKKGVPVRLNVSVNGASRDCRSVVRLPALGAQAFVEAGKAVPMSFTPSQAGVYEFNCPMQMMNPSYLVVTN